MTLFIKALLIDIVVAIFITIGYVLFPSVVSVWKIIIPLGVGILIGQILIKLDDLISL